MNLLFLALAEVQHTGNNAQIALPSFTAILRDLGLTTHSKNRKLLKASFALWSQLIVSFEGCWYLDKGEHETRDLPPPFVKVRYRRFQTWCCNEILRRVLTDVANELRDKGALDEEECFIDWPKADAPATESRGSYWG